MRRPTMLTQRFAMQKKLNEESKQMSSKNKSESKSFSKTLIGSVKELSLRTKL